MLIRGSLARPFQPAMPHSTLPMTLCGSLVRKAHSMISLKRFLPVSVLALAVLSGCANSKAESEPAASFLFVQSASSATVDTAANGVITLSLHKVSNKTIYFSDRPKRLSGHTNTTDFITQWNSPDVQDSFKTDPPNAAIEGTKTGTSQEETMVVELTNPRLNGTTLTYTATRVDTPSEGLSHYKGRHQPNLSHDLTNVNIFIDNAPAPLPTDPRGTHALPYSFSATGATLYYFCVTSSTSQSIKVSMTSLNLPAAPSTVHHALSPANKLTGGQSLRSSRQQMDNPNPAQ